MLWGTLILGAIAVCLIGMIASNLTEDDVQ